MQAVHGLCFTFCLSAKGCYMYERTCRPKPKGFVFWKVIVHFVSVRQRQHLLSAAFQPIQRLFPVFPIRFAII